MKETFNEEDFYISEYAWPLDPKEREIAEAGLAFYMWKQKMEEWKRDKIKEMFSCYTISDLYDLVQMINNVLTYEGYDIPKEVREHFDEESVEFYIRAIKEVRQEALKLIERIEEGELK